MNGNFSAVWSAADEAGKAAVEKIAVRPMIVNGSGGQQYYVADGVCGFAWISFPGNIPFAKYAKAKLGARKGYPKGLHIWVGAYSQSMQKKEAYAHAVAASLRDAGIPAYGQSRMD